MSVLCFYPNLKKQTIEIRFIQNGPRYSPDWLVVSKESLVAHNRMDPTNVWDRAEELTSSSENEEKVVDFPPHQ
ncbi:hypothetical protein RUM43_007652 [Polyplax serrata]|uniref:Uncharacterized protein n=1 Tax=Polyplax serrata TaxID=468196 RepID=A0AAN8S8S1_POLSC